MPPRSAPCTSHDPRLLLVDTCGAAGTIALTTGRRVLAGAVLPGRTLSERLIPAIAGVLREARLRLAELDAVCVVRGPGSFTGVRVGLSAAKALGEGGGLPLIALSRLQVLSDGRTRDHLAVLSAGRGELFWARQSACVVEEEGVAARGVILAEALAKHLPIVCESEEAEYLPGAELLERPALTARDGVDLALQRMAEGAFADPMLLDGLYLHRTEQEILDRQARHRAERLQAAERT